MVYTSLTFYFAAFYFAFVYLQLIQQNGMWLPKAVHQPPLWLGLVASGSVILAGIVYFWGQWSGLYRKNFGVLRLALWVAFVLGVISLIFHVYAIHNHPGFANLQLGAYVSVFTGLEGVYTVLLFFSDLVLLGLAIRAQRGLFNVNGIAIDAFGEYWGWLAAIALANFGALWLQPFFHSA